MRYGMVIIVVGAALQLMSQEEPPWDQVRLERILRYDCEPRDFYPEGEPPYVPLRNRDALKEFETFISHSGWTTNQFIEGLIFAFTNNITDANWADADKRCIAGRAVWKLGEINRPAVTNFFRAFCEGDSPRCKGWVVESFFPYTNLEPEVLSYMRTLCVQTNIYRAVETGVMHYMFETLDTMPAELKPAATNRVAQYMYFAIRHTTRQMAWQDRMLASFIPAYSNSLQRLDAMRYVASTATNARQRVRAQMEIDRLTALPTNQLNDVSWIAE